MPLNRYVAAGNWDWAYDDIKYAARKCFCIATHKAVNGFDFDTNELNQLMEYSVKRTNMNNNQKN